MVLIPFIDEKRLISAMRDCDSRLSEQEKNRNRHGPMQVYVYTEEDLGKRRILSILVGTKTCCFFHRRV